MVLYMANVCSATPVFTLVMKERTGSQLKFSLYQISSLKSVDAWIEQNRQTERRSINDQNIFEVFPGYLAVVNDRHVLAIRNEQEILLRLGPRVSSQASIWIPNAVWCTSKAAALWKCLCDICARWKQASRRRPTLGNHWKCFWVQWHATD